MLSEDQLWRWTGDLPKFLKGDGDLDAIGRLRGIEVDVGSFRRRDYGHGWFELVMQLGNPMEHEKRSRKMCFNSRCKGTT